MSIFAVIFQLAENASIKFKDLLKGYAGGDVFDLIGDVDPTNEDGDIRMGDSTGISASLDGEIFSEEKKCQESNIGDSDNTGDGGHHKKVRRIVRLKDLLVKSSKKLEEVFLGAWATGAAPRNNSIWNSTWRTGVGEVVSSVIGGILSIEARDMDTKLLSAPESNNTLTRYMTNYQYWLLIAPSGWSFVFAVPSQMTHLVAIITLDSARSCMMQGLFLTQGTVSSIPIVLSWGGSIRPEGFWPSILLLMVIIVTVAIVVVVVLVIIDTIIGIVVVGVPSIIKLAFVITGGLIGLFYSNRVVGRRHHSVNNPVTATTTSSLEAEQDSGNIDKTQSKATPNESSSSGITSGCGPRCQEAIRDTIAQTRFENVSVLSNDSLLARGNTLQSDEDRQKLNELIELCTNLQSRVLDLEKKKTTQGLEITSLKRRVKKVEKKQRSRTHKLKRLYKVGLTARLDSFEYEQSLGEDASKQGRKINDIDADEDITLVNDQYDAEMFDVNDLHVKRCLLKKKLTIKRLVLLVKLMLLALQQLLVLLQQL
uniref:Transmembrane protein n=1 Tax=Tanacetum cinerariifolium TaxID=118510 RepID=A0A6L2LYI9_TANCI|nr:hypothetical protein [Tanacetum cinerariifolium]